MAKLKVTVFGASGRVGRLVVEEALRHGYEVTAFTHSKNLPEAAGLSVKQGDIHDAADVARAVEGSQAVISALGSWGTPGKDVLAAGMQNIIAAMDSAGIKRLVSLSGSDARAAGDDLGLLHRLSRASFKLIANKVLTDGEKHIKLLEASDLDWTVLRSPRMSKHGDSYKLVSQRSQPWSSVGRPSVASCLVEQLEDTEHIKQAPFIARA